MREQTIRLNKTPGTEVQAGVLQSGVTQGSVMPYVQQQKTNGQRLAESLGLVVNTAATMITKVTEEKLKKQSIIDDVEYSSYAKKIATNGITEIEQMPLDQREQAYSQRLVSDIENLKTQYKGGAITDTAFKSYVTTLTSNYDAFANKAKAQVSKNKMDEQEAKVKSYLADFGTYGNIDIDSVSNIYGISKPDIASFWLNDKIALTTKAYQDGNITASAAIKQLDSFHKSMSTKDNPNIWKNSDYVLSVNRAKASLLSDVAAQNTKAAKALEDQQKEVSNVFKARLLNATDDSNFSTVLSDAYDAAASGKIKWEHYTDIVEASRETKYEIQPTAPLTENSFEDARLKARTDSTFTYEVATKLKKDGNIDAKQLADLETIIEKRVKLENQIEKENKGDSWTRGNKLISEATKQGMIVNPNDKALYTGMMQEYLDSVSGGQDPYETAKLIVEKYQPKVAKVTKAEARKNNIGLYMVSTYKADSFTPNGLSKAFVKAEKQVRVNLLQDLLEAKNGKQISIEDYKEFYRLIRGE